MTSGQLASALQRGTVTGANNNRTTALVAVAGRGGNVESPNTRAHTAAAKGGQGGVTTGQLASALLQGTVTGANLNRMTAPAVAGHGCDNLQHVVQNQIAVGKGGRLGRTAGQSLAKASQSGRLIAAYLNRTFTDLAVHNTATNRDGPAVRAGGNTGGPAIQHGTRLARASTAFIHDKCVKEHVFLKQKFASLQHDDLDFSNNPQSICRMMAAALDIAEDKVEGRWETSKLSVHKAMKTHGNNVIKAIRNIVRGKTGSG